MLKVIIVEDDNVALTLLERLVQKKFPEIRVIKGFDDPRQAIEFMDNNYIDLIITDVKMPGMSGVELAEYAAKKYPFIKVVFISAFRDFDAICKVLNTNVISYILKPITPDKLQKAFESVLEPSSIQRTGLSFVSESLQKQRVAFAKEIVTNKNMTMNEIQTELQQLEIPVDVRAVQCLVIHGEINNYDMYIHELWKYGENKLTIAIENMIADLNTQECFGIVYSFDDGKIKILYFVDREYREFFEERIIILQKTMETMLKILVDFSVVLAGNSIYEMTRGVNTKSEETNLIAEIFDSDKEYLTDKEKISILYPTESELEGFCRKLSAKAINLLGTEYFQKKNYNLYEYVNCSSYGAFMEFVTQTIKFINEFKREYPNIDVFEKVKKYIAENYMHAISLDDISQYVAFAPSSFCRFFKKISGKSFTSYLNEYRIKKAVGVLKKNPDIKISVLSSMVGFSALSNFYKNFRLFTGVTPSEFLKKEQKD